MASSYCNVGSTGVKSYLSGKTYNFVRDNDGSSKRRAIAALQQEDFLYQQAAEKRPRHEPAPLTRAETMATIKGTGGNDLSEQDRLAAMRRHLASVAAEPTYRPGSAAQKARRIEYLTQCLAQAENVLAMKEARAAVHQDPVFQSVLADAKERLDVLRLRGDISQALLDEASASVELLKNDCDVIAFQSRSADIQARSQSARDAEILRLRQQQAELNQQIQLTRAEIIGSLADPVEESPAETTSE